VFTDCLKENVIDNSGEIDEKVLLKCKKVAFMDYFDRVTNYEQDLAQRALTKYA
jgi:hypothetical protein